MEKSEFASILPDSAKPRLTNWESRVKPSVLVGVGDVIPDTVSHRTDPSSGVTTIVSHCNSLTKSEGYVQTIGVANGKVVRAECECPYYTHKHGWWWCKHLAKVLLWVGENDAVIGDSVERDDEYVPPAEEL